MLAVSVFGVISCTGKKETIQAKPTSKLDHFDISTPGNTQTAGQPFPITITAKDGNDNVCDSFYGSVNLSDLTGTISPGMTMSFSGGKWTDNVSIKGYHSNDKITATYENKKGTSNSFIVHPSGIPWNEARLHIGETTTVYGPVVGTKWATGSKGKPTFLNIGKDHPDPSRFTVVIWVGYRNNFNNPEAFYKGKTISVTGRITSYQGIAQIEAQSPSQIQVW